MRGAEPVQQLVGLARPVRRLQDVAGVIVGRLTIPALRKRCARLGEAAGQRQRTGRPGKLDAGNQQLPHVLRHAVAAHRGAHRSQRHAQRREEAGDLRLALDVQQDVGQPVRRAGLLLGLLHLLQRLQEVPQFVRQQPDGHRRILCHVDPLERRRQPDVHAVGRSSVILSDGDRRLHQPRCGRRDDGQHLVGRGVERTFGCCAALRRKPRVLHVHGAPPTRSRRCPAAPCGTPRRPRGQSPPAGRSRPPGTAGRRAPRRS